MTGARLNSLALVRAPAQPAQPLGGGVGRGAEPPSEGLALMALFGAFLVARP